MATIAENLSEAAEMLEASGVEEARRQAVLLMSFAIGRDRTFLIAHPEYRLTGEEESRFSAAVERRAAREPLQYITGRQEFYGLEFEVSPGVLIPRPETEMIVEAAVEFLSPKREPRFCEVGIGSGCIAVSILRNVPAASAVGLDISPTALEIAERNAEKHGVAGRIDFRRSDVFEAAGEERFDLIASNPPYVPRADLGGLQEEVRDFEPAGALTDGGDGLSIIRRIVAGSPERLVANGMLLMEIGFSQSAAVREMFDTELWEELDILPDLQGIPRMVKAIAK